MTLNLTESVVACDTCGFAGLVGSRIREWMSYRMATTAERWVRFGFCITCGISYVRPYYSGPVSRQPAPLSLGAGPLQVALWELVALDPDSGECPTCGPVGELLWWLPEPPLALSSVWCPVCWAGPLRLTDRRASHPGW